MLPLLRTVAAGSLLALLAGIAALAWPRKSKAASRRTAAQEAEDEGQYFLLKDNALINVYTSQYLRLRFLLHRGLHQVGCRTYPFRRDDHA